MTSVSVVRPLLRRRHGCRAIIPMLSPSSRRCLGVSASSALVLPQLEADRIVDVSDLAMELRQPVREYTKLTSNKNVKLVGILAADDTESGSGGWEDAELYSEVINSTCREDGIDYEVCRVPGNHPQDVAAAIQDANERNDVDGILVYYPIFKRRDNARGPYKNRITGVYYKSHDDYLRDLVSPKKDVEGLCHSYNARWLFRSGDSSLSENVVYPCTALAVFKILERLGDVQGSTITVINRSEIFGRPLAAMLASCGANVYSIDEDSILLFRHGGRLRRVSDMTLQRCLKASSMVVSAVPSELFSLPCEFINSDSTVVNVSEFENISEGVLQIPNVRLVPNVGKVTVAALEQNLIQLHKNRNS